MAASGAHAAHDPSCVFVHKAQSAKPSPSHTPTIMTLLGQVSARDNCLLLSLLGPWPRSKRLVSVLISLISDIVLLDICLICGTLVERVELAPAPLGLARYCSLAGIGPSPLGGKRSNKK